MALWHLLGPTVAKKFLGSMGMSAPLGNTKVSDVPGCGVGYGDFSSAQSVLWLSELP